MHITSEFMIYIILNYCIRKKEDIYISYFKVEFTCHTLYLPHLSYISISLDIINTTLISIIHTSLHIIVRLNLIDLVSINQEELLLLKTLSSFILDLAVSNRVSIKENNDLKLDQVSS